MDMNWEKLKIFYYVACANSMTAAAKQINLDQSTISRQIIALENSIQAKLFSRKSRKIKLTSKGEILFNATQKIYDEIKATQDLMKQVL